MGYSTAPPSIGDPSVWLNIVQAAHPQASSSSTTARHSLLHLMRGLLSWAPFNIWYYILHIKQSLQLLLVMLHQIILIYRSVYFHQDFLFSRHVTRHSARHWFQGVLILRGFISIYVYSFQCISSPSFLATPSNTPATDANQYSYCTEVSLESPLSSRYQVICSIVGIRNRKKYECRMLKHKNWGESCALSFLYLSQSVLRQKSYVLGQKRKYQNRYYLVIKGAQ